MRYRLYEGTVKLQGIGLQLGLKAGNLEVGDVLIWNGGSTSEVMEIKFSPSGKTVYVTVKYFDEWNKEYRLHERTMRASRLVATRNAVLTEEIAEELNTVSVEVVAVEEIELIEVETVENETAAEVENNTSEVQQVAKSFKNLMKEVENGNLTQEQYTSMVLTLIDNLGMDLFDELYKNYKDTLIFAKEPIDKLLKRCKVNTSKDGIIGTIINSQYYKKRYDELVAIARSINNFMGFGNLEKWQLVILITHHKNPSMEVATEIAPNITLNDTRKAHSRVKMINRRISINKGVNSGREGILIAVGYFEMNRKLQLRYKAIIEGLTNSLLLQKEEFTILN